MWYFEKCYITNLDRPARRGYYSAMSTPAAALPLPPSAATLLGRPLSYHSRVASTQEIARAAAQSGAPEGLAVVADEQSAGRGRGKRAWWSPAGGGLYLSLLLRPAIAARHIAWVTMALSLGAVEAIQQLCGAAVSIKWPNDLQWQGRKLAGVLAEGAFAGNRLDYVIAGIGLNLAADFSTQPELAAIAVSLHEIAGHAIDRDRLLAVLLAATEHHYLLLQAGHSPMPAWKERLHTLGQAVVVSTADGEVITGVASDVEPDGALRIELPQGGWRIVHAGDVSLRSM